MRNPLQDVFADTTRIKEFWPNQPEAHSNGLVPKGMRGFPTPLHKPIRLRKVV